MEGRVEVALREQSLNREPQAWDKTDKHATKGGGMEDVSTSIAPFNIQLDV